MSSLWPSIREEKMRGLPPSSLALPRDMRCGDQGMRATDLELLPGHALQLTFKPEGIDTEQLHDFRILDAVKKLDSRLMLRERPKCEYEG
jgi:hypothetical protein